MKIRITDTFELSETEVKYVILNNNLTVEGNDRRTPLRDYLTSVVRNAIASSTEGMEEQILAEKKVAQGKLAKKLNAVARASGISVEELLAQLQALAAEPEPVEEDLDDEDDSEDNEEAPAY